jgi:hypothetical protein
MATYWVFIYFEGEFHAVTLQGTIFGEGVPLYQQAHLVTTPQRGDAMLKTIGSHRACPRPASRRRQKACRILFAS